MPLFGSPPASTSNLVVNDALDMNVFPIICNDFRGVITNFDTIGSRTLSTPVSIQTGLSGGNTTSGAYETLASYTIQAADISDAKIFSQGKFKFTLNCRVKNGLPAYWGRFRVLINGVASAEQQMMQGGNYALYFSGSAKAGEVVSVQACVASGGTMNAIIDSWDIERTGDDLQLSGATLTDINTILGHKYVPVGFSVNADAQSISGSFASLTFTDKEVVSILPVLCDSYSISGAINPYTYSMTLLVLALEE